jgi:hypothetical protein
MAEHPPNLVPRGAPITLGHGFRTWVWVPAPKGSWALPILHERITSQETSFGTPLACEGRGH